METPPRVMHMATQGHCHHIRLSIKCFSTAATSELQVFSFAMVILCSSHVRNPLKGRHAQDSPEYATDTQPPLSLWSVQWIQISINHLPNKTLQSLAQTIFNTPCALRTAEASAFSIFFSCNPRRPQLWFPQANIALQKARGHDKMDQT